MSEELSASFDLLRKRLAAAAATLRGKADRLNARRIELFGRTEPKLLARLSGRTENNCVARDLVRVGNTLVFGYNVFIGLKKETQVSDVFCLYQLSESPDGTVDLLPQPLAGSFLDEPRFVADFRELYTYYKATALDQLRLVGERLLVVFRTGSKATDKRVFRFLLKRDGGVQYEDNRGDRDHVLPPTHDFEWTPVGREMHVLGRHPHVNIADTVFVETIGGDLTIKVENNTESGLGVYSEAVEDKTQALADAEIAFADLKHLLLLRVRPYREQTTRYLVFNKRLRQVLRIDAIGSSCVQLPEDHGIVFPGGYYLESGECKQFGESGADFSAFRLKRSLRAPNGEDVLYIFYEELSGKYVLLPYNLIDRAVGQALLAEGYARFEDGRMLLFTPESAEPTRLHVMQLWRTPFAFEEHVAARPRVSGLLGRLGNAELVRGLAEIKQLVRLSEDARSLGEFDRLLKIASRCADAFLWFKETEAEALDVEVQMLARTGRAALEAFEQLERGRADARSAVHRQEQQVAELVSRIASLLWQKPEDFTEAIRTLKRKRGELTALGERPYVDGTAVAALDTRLREELDRVGVRALKFFADPKAFASLRHSLQQTDAKTAAATTTSALAPLTEQLDQLVESLDGLSELIASFEQTDAQARAELLQATSTLYAEANKLRAQQKAKRSQLLEREQGMEFGAQLTVLEQALNNQLARVDSPEAVDEALARSISQIEALETRFGDQPRFAGELVSRREAALEAFAGRREQLQVERDQRAQGLREAIQRVLDGIPRRLRKLENTEELHAFFAGDGLVERARTQLQQLRAMGQVVLADELDGKLRALKESGLRDARDRAELGAAGDAIALGGKRFTVERRTLDLALLNTPEGLVAQLTGTDYRRPLQAPELDAYRDLWDQVLGNENALVYRAEYLAWVLWQRAAGGDATLNEALWHEGGALAELVSAEAQARPAEDYRRGVHDADATAVLKALAQLAAQAQALAMPAAVRLLAQAWFADLDEPQQIQLRQHAAALHWLLAQKRPAPLPQRWLEALADRAALLESTRNDPGAATQAALHLVEALGAGGDGFAMSGAALDLAEQVRQAVPRTVLAGVRESQLPPFERLELARAWALAVAPDTPAALALEAAGALVFEVPQRRINAALVVRIEGLLGEHPRIQSGVLSLDLPEFCARLRLFTEQTQPRFRAMVERRHAIAEVQRKRLKLAQFQPRPLAGFVRNRLIDEVYLPLIANNLAKQIGTLDDTRSDRSGMLLLISPPGYGKTTLMEYLADRLGMIFVRINGPTLGHDIVALDPAATEQSAAREELEKLNLGLAMGNNVMLYLDDIQHLSPEFLQKFISLADGTRRIDAILDGQAVTLDLRGKRFAIVMAGNPYTESGETFRIPDMLANRADVYNLGDVLSGRESAFADSYVENALTANRLTAPLNERPRDVMLAALRSAAGDESPLPADFPQANDALAVLKRMLDVRTVLMRVNSAYVGSAAQDDAFRTEPPFKLQGSYRNMVKLAAQLSPLLSDSELDALIRDHYRGEAQTLGARAEENLLKLAQLIGQPGADESARWQSLVEDFQRIQKQGGKHSDGSTKIANLLADIAVQLQKQAASDSEAGQQMVRGLGSIAAQLDKQARQTGELQKLLAGLSDLRDVLSRKIELDTPPVLTESFTALTRAYEETFVPLVSSLHHKLRLDQSIWEHVRQIRTDLDTLAQRTSARAKKAPD